MDAPTRRRRKPRKSRKLNLRITPEMESDLADVCAAMGGQDVSDYVRHAIAAMLRQENRWWRPCAGRPSLSG